MGKDYERIYLKKLDGAQKEFISNIRDFAAHSPRITVRLKTYINTYPIYYTMTIDIINVTTHLIIGRNIKNNIVEAIQLVDFVTGFAHIIGGG